MLEEPSVCPICGAVVAMDLPCPGCTIAALAGGQAPASGSKGPNIPGLIVHEEIGEGGFGVVYRATQKDLVQRAVALKILKPGVDTRQVLRRFSVERQALALLEHPNIARFYQAGETSNGYPWFTMEFIRGEPISDVFAGRELEPLLETFLSVCGAVAYAHDKGVIHRDLKPSNILVTPDGVPKVIDFGIAKATGATPGMTLYTADELSVGTPAYMAPEKTIDERSDVYALGTVLFELLSDTVPPESGKFPPPSSIAIRKIPQAMDSIVQRAVDEDPAKRYQSVRDLTADIRRFLNGEEIMSAKRGHWGYFAVLVGIVAGIAFFLVCIKEESREPSPQSQNPEASLPSMILEEDGKFPFRILVTPDHLHGLVIYRGGGRAVFFSSQTGLENGAVTSDRSKIRSAGVGADGRSFLLGFENGTFRRFEASTGKSMSKIHDVTPSAGRYRTDIIEEYAVRKGESSHYFSASGDATFRAWNQELEEQWQAPLVSNPHGIAFSPDHTLAVAGSASGQVSLIDLDLQKRLAVLDESKGRTTYLSFSADGSLFATSNDQGQVHVWSKDGKLKHALEHPDHAEEFAFSPDSRNIVTGCHDGVVRIWDLDSGKQTGRLLHDHEVLCLAFSPDGSILASGGQDNAVRFWEFETGEPFCDPFPVKSAIEKMTFVKKQSGGLNLIALTWERAVRVIPVR